MQHTPLFVIRSPISAHSSVTPVVSVTVQDTITNYIGAQSIKPHEAHLARLELIPSIYVQIESGHHHVTLWHWRIQGAPKRHAPPPSSPTPSPGKLTFTLLYVVCVVFYEFENGCAPPPRIFFFFFFAFHYRGLVMYVDATSTRYGNIGGGGGGGRHSKRGHQCSTYPYYPDM